MAKQDEELFAVPRQDDSNDENAKDDGVRAIEDAFIVPVTMVKPMPDQPRTYFDEVLLQELADSVKEVQARGGGIGGTGILQPILVRRSPISHDNPEGRPYLIKAGERRWRATQIAGLTQVPILVTDTDKATSYEEAIIENIIRADLSVSDECDAVAKLKNDYGYTYAQIQQRTGKSKGWVENRLMVGSATEDVKKLVHDKPETVVVAGAISQVKDKGARQKFIRRVKEGVPAETVKNEVADYRIAYENYVPAKSKFGSAKPKDIKTFANFDVELRTASWLTQVLDTTNALRDTTIISEKRRGALKNIERLRTELEELEHVLKPKRSKKEGAE